MTAPMWMALMPLVLLERVLFALGMVVAHHVLSFVFGKIDADVADKKQAVLATKC